MGIEILKERLHSLYRIDIGTAPLSIVERAFKEMGQEIVLRGLALGGFFKQARFHGGACLRILYKLQRFSEDLVFTLAAPRKGFDIGSWSNAVIKELEAFGLPAKVKFKGGETAVAKAFVILPPIDSLLGISSREGNRRKLRIKLEVDTNPPAGQASELATLLWPTAVPIVSLDISSLFAGKLHALLTREYTKGRDWYDLAWHVQRRSTINLVYLRNALIQTGGIKSDTEVDVEFIREGLKRRLAKSSLKTIKEDVRPLAEDARDIDMWSKELFVQIIEKLHETVGR